MNLTLILPCYNEEKNISLMIDECEKVFNEKNIKIEYILINDGSEDNTYEEIKKLKDRNINLIGINFSRNFGKEAAIYAGLCNASGDFTVLIDSDLQQHPKYVLEMYNFIKSHPEYDCISCYQEKRKESKLKCFLKKLFYKTINKVSDVDFHEDASDFRLFNKKVLNSLLEMKEYHRFSKGLFSWVGFNTYYMPYEVEERKYGKTSWSLRSLFKYAINGIVGFSTSLLKVSTYIGIFSFLASIIYLIWVIIEKLIWNNSISGYTTIVCLILIFGGLQMIFIGIIGEYLGKVYIETKNRPIYIVKEEIRKKMK